MKIKRPVVLAVCAMIALIVILFTFIPNLLGPGSWVNPGGQGISYGAQNSGGSGSSGGVYEDVCKYARTEEERSVCSACVAYCYVERDGCASYNVLDGGYSTVKCRDGVEFLCGENNGVVICS